MRFVVISLLFNVFWLTAALGQSSTQWLLVAMLAAAIFYQRNVLRAIITLTPIGLVGDNVLIHFGWLATEPVSTWMPEWLALLWCGFCAFIWLLREIILAHSLWAMSLIGALGGASSYVAGERLGAIVFPQPWLTTSLVLVAVWAVYSVILIHLMRWLVEKTQPTTLASGGE
ncbi:hypothetical protein BZJ19_08225 [Salinivibrio proteolyticus]|uniref:DUF2878 domain-containing protein n=1 Tax=Salinivibrio proteolyticus TaxID=334715 RepID=UPI000988BAE4|nr:DUF2878 domain-containing protein [Salinivibrio proteolyticus]OOF25613.1 hypothetical protein BZJ19_08225 [Salinivibrio proteolyticus]